MVELKKLSANCDFGNFLTEALRDRLVCGWRSNNIQKKLLAEVDLTFEGAVRISVTMETADKDTFGFGGREQTESVYANMKDGNIEKFQNR